MAEVEKYGGKPLALPVDVADPDAVEAAAARVEDRFGPIDIWVNCAMATIFAPFHRITPEEYRRATYRAIPLQSAYCGAKFAIRGFTDSLRSELIHDGVDVQLVMVQMPALNTPQFDWARNKMRRRPQPVPPIFQPEGRRRRHRLRRPFPAS